MKRIYLGVILGLALAGTSNGLSAADETRPDPKTQQLYDGAQSGKMIQLPIAGDFQPPKKPGLPPLKWNLLSGSRGTLEYLRDEKGGSIMMTPATQSSSLGIYSSAVPAVAGNRIRVEATIYGDKIEVLLMQYANGASSQKEVVDADREGKRTVCFFTVKDNAAKGPTKQIRIGFRLKGSAATVADVKVFRIE